ncbi:MAG: phospholipase D-like domain-containing protein, partial [Deltaproteobacteria bacterium]|nr:phospholipase D-like domain-containing protein [Deltaproteobacteria bacterium]
MPTTSIQFYFEGDDYFKAVAEAISGAQKSVDVEIYYLADDALGMEFASLLAATAKKGICVRLIYDAFGCRNTSGEFLEDLKKEGIQIKEYNSLFSPDSHFRRRNHRKMVIVDGAIGFIGGFNYSVDYSARHKGKEAWRDTGCRIVDEKLVLVLSFIFHHSWQGRVEKAREFIRHRGRRPLLTGGAPHFILANYGRGKSLIREEYLSAIARSRKRVWITTPYFVPDRGIRSALRRAARRGIDVRLLVPGITDIPVVSWAAESTYASLFAAGVKIYEYQGRVMHAKCAVADDDWFTVGTANLDQMSFFSNLEVNLFGQDSDKTQILSSQFENDLQSAKRIDP